MTAVKVLSCWRYCPPPRRRAYEVLKAAGTVASVVPSKGEAYSIEEATQHVLVVYTYSEVLDLKDVMAQH